MVAITNYDVTPLGDEVARSCREREIDTPACILAPNEVAELVSPIEEALLEDLLVEACAIETNLHRHLYVAAESLVAWCSPYSVRVEALVENKTLIVWLIVEVYLVSVGVYLTHTEVRRDLIENVAILVADDILYVVELWILRRPSLVLLHRDNHRNTLYLCHLLLRNELLAILDIDGEGVRCGGGVVARSDNNLMVVDVGDHLHVVERVFVGSLHPNSLPDTCCTGVDAAV